MRAAVLASAIASAILLGLITLPISTAVAQTDSTGVLRYELTDLSAFETGCFELCECPIFTRPLQGQFYLKHLGYDPLFDYYEVRSVHWTVPDATSNLVITGSGTYKVGGEFAIQQQMILDLSIGGAAPRRFDSGLVVGGGEFPKVIRIDVSLHQDPACVDTVLHIDAVDPVVTSVETGSGAALFRADIAPNPFHESAEIRLFLGRSAPLQVTVYDARGRMVRRLSAGAVVPAGFRFLAWDGRADKGTACAAGIYFLKAQAGASKTLSRIIKLK